MVTFTCVVPTHRRSEFLSLALKSVLEQDYAPIEIIVVSDCVDPAAQEVCADLTRVSPIPLNYIENLDGRGGASSSRNRGAEAASGDYLAFLDDDDLWAQTYLSAVADLVEERNLDLVVTWITEFLGDDLRGGPRMPDGMRAQEVASINPGATGSNMVIRATSWSAVGGFDEELKVKNDTDFLYRVLRSGVRYGTVKNALVLQRKHQSGQLTARTEKRAAGTEKYLKKHLPSLTAEDVRILRQQIFRIRFYAQKKVWIRAWYFLRMMGLYRFGELRAKLVSGRENRHTAVAAFDEDRHG
ncbi:MAG: glycosyltransferase family A protein [Microbacterium sp.]|uniref:glycosyltransferase family 2 protein n=1 Tax=Microbacterium sp. TaxID=51671 RepID=UPI0039E70FEB